jgi:hypothetical protein
MEVKCDRCHDFERIAMWKPPNPEGARSLVARMRRLPGSNISVNDGVQISECLVQRWFGPESGGGADAADAGSDSGRTGGSDRATDGVHDDRATGGVHDGEPDDASDDNGGEDGGDSDSGGDDAN